MRFRHPLQRRAQRGGLGSVDGDAGAAGADIHRVHIVDAPFAADHAMASLTESVRFLLEMTPLNADDVRAAFLAHPESDPVFEYRK